MTKPWLTDDEINGICNPLRQSSAQCRYLKSLGLVVKARRNGRPLVARDEWLRVMVGGHTASQSAAATGSATPDREGLFALLGRKNKNGTSAQR